MKKHIIIISILALCLSQYSQAQDKDVYWMHGMGGDGYMMHILGNKYRSERKMVSRTFTYNTENGIIDASRKMRAKMPVKNTNVIMIAQCMGGVCARYAKHEQPSAFGGLITMGAPHSGTDVAANLYNGVFADFQNAIKTKGLRGPSTSIDKVGLDLFGLGTLAYLYNGFSSESLISRFFLNDLEIPTESFGSDKTQRDFVPGSSVLNQLKGMNANIPKIAIWGNESGNALMKLAGSKLKNSQHFNKYGRYVDEGKLNDHEVVEMITRLKDHCRTQKIVNGGLANHYSHWTTVLSTGGTSLIAAKLHRTYESKWNESYVFWNGEFHTGCDKLIGAVRYERKVEYYLDYECENTNLFDYQMKKRLKVKDYNYDGCPKVLVEKKRVYTETITTPSDGLITKDRATALPGVAENCKVRADYVNHDELKNHPEMFRIFKEIFEGAISDGRNRDFFKVSTR